MDFLGSEGTSQFNLSSLLAVTDTYMLHVHTYIYIIQDGPHHV